MTNVKYYKVTRCSECPEYDYVEHKGWTCKMMELPVEDKNKIPDWCPLEDVK